MKRYNEGWDIKEASPDYWEWVAQMEVGQEGGQLQSTHLEPGGTSSQPLQLPPLSPIGRRAAGPIPSPSSVT